MPCWFLQLSFASHFKPRHLISGGIWIQEIKGARSLSLFLLLLNFSETKRHTLWYPMQWFWMSQERMGKQQQTTNRSLFFNDHIVSPCLALYQGLSNIDFFTKVSCQCLLRNNIRMNQRCCSMIWPFSLLFFRLDQKVVPSTLDVIPRQVKDDRDREDCCLTKPSCLTAWLQLETGWIVDTLLLLYVKNACFLWRMVDDKDLPVAYPLRIAPFIDLINKK